MNASQASRCACSEFENSLLEPFLGGFRVRIAQRTLAFRRVLLLPLTSSSAGLGAHRSTRSLGQAKEPRARPMRPGDLLGDHGQRAVALAVIFEPVLANL